MSGNLREDLFAAVDPYATDVSWLGDSGETDPVAVLLQAALATEPRLTLRVHAVKDDHAEILLNDLPAIELDLATDADGLLNLLRVLLQSIASGNYSEQVQESSTGARHVSGLAQLAGGQQLLIGRQRRRATTLTYRYTNPD